MDVYLVPASRDRYELYCEVAHPVLAPVDAPNSSLWGRAVGVFSRALAEGEAARRGPVPEGESTSGRLRRTVMRKIAEAVAEQRLLWHLRGETAAQLIYPDDIPASAALDRMRQSFASDRDKHRRWLVIDGLLSLVSAPFTVVPGPNLFLYFFLFRTVGHFLSMRGADQSLRRILWTPVASAPLTELRAALPLERESRSRRIDEIAAALGLCELGVFVDNVADR